MIQADVGELCLWFKVEVMFALEHDPCCYWCVLSEVHACGTASAGCMILADVGELCGLCLR